MVEEVPESEKSKALTWQLHYTSKMGKVKKAWKKILYGSWCRFNYDTYDNYPNYRSWSIQGSWLDIWRPLMNCWLGHVLLILLLSIFLGGLRSALEKLVRLREPHLVQATRVSAVRKNYWSWLDNEQNRSIQAFKNQTTSCRCSRGER